MNTKKRSSATPYLDMEYRKDCPTPTCSQPTFRERSVMDVGATSSILPLRIALNNNFNIIKPKKKIILTLALGQKLSVQGIASVWTKAEDGKTFRLIHFIVSSDATKLLISFRDQVTLKILPASYPYHLGSDEEEETVKFPEKRR